MTAKHKVVAVLACTLVTACALAGCAGNAQSSNAERSFTDEELAEHDGNSYFPEEFTFDELCEDHKLEPGHPSKDGYSEGAFKVANTGEDGTIPSGVYYIEGSEDATGDIIVYSPIKADGEEQMYQLRYPFRYLGFSLIQLEEGQAVFFLPPEQADIMKAAPEIPLDVSSPYKSGTYRVGVDIPEGLYDVTQDEACAALLEDQKIAQPGAIVYQGFNYASGEELQDIELPFLKDGKEVAQIEVKDGQVLELYGCIATLAEEL